MNHVQTKFVWGTDKRDHFLTGFAGGFTASVAVRWGGHPHGISIITGIGTGLVAGVSKEIYDYNHPANHTADIWDASFTILGATCGALFAQLLRF